MIRLLFAGFFLLFPAALLAEECTETVLISSAWKHMKSGDVLVLKKNGKISCRNETNYRNECDYVYSSNFMGKPKSWEIIRPVEMVSPLDVNKVKVAFSKDFLFKKESHIYPCEYDPSEKKLQVDVVVLVQMPRPGN